MISTLETWHLAGNEDEIKVTDFELQLWRVFYGLQRWQEECERNSNGNILTSNELAILHIIRMKNRPKTLTDIERLLNRNDTHNIRYSINKLLKMDLIQKTHSVYSSKNYYYEITEEGRKDTDNYSRMRKFILIHMFKESGLDLEELAKNLTKIKAIYDEADRAVAQNLLNTHSDLSQSKTNNPANIEQGKILLVEDHSITAHLTRTILSDFNYQIDIAQTGIEALELTEKCKYDIIFMDIGLSDISGAEVTQKIRKEAQNLNPHTPIIGLTAHVSSENKQGYMEAGMNAVSLKPLMKDKIQDILSMFSSKYSNQDNQDSKLSNSMKSSQHQNQDHDPDLLSKLPIIDLELGAKLVGGDRTFAKEAIQMLIASFSEEISSLENACQTMDLDKAESILHKLRGGISYCGVPRLRAACIRFDDYLKTGDTEASQVLAHYDFLINEFNNLKNKLASVP